MGSSSSVCFITVFFLRVLLGSSSVDWLREGNCSDLIYGPSWFMPAPGTLNLLLYFFSYQGVQLASSLPLSLSLLSSFHYEANPDPNPQSKVSPLKAKSGGPKPRPRSDGFRREISGQKSHHGQVKILKHDSELRLPPIGSAAR